MKIAIAGTGYVGLSLATLLSQEHEVVALDIIPEKVEQINNRISPISDHCIEEFFQEKKLKLRATLDYEDAFTNADFIIISTPTNYDPERNFFDTSSVEDILQKAKKLRLTKATLVIKSTVPVGFTEKVKKKFHLQNIFFSPEFLREGKALFDNLHPSRIIIGDNTNAARRFGQILLDAAKKKDTPILYMPSTEAEAVKLFANTYLALRVAYFNELDTYAESKGLSTKDIIAGVSLDPRIGDYYNNPSFGYGGYCLPKDTKQLLANYKDVPQNLISAIVTANDTRKNYIVTRILKQNPQVVGIYRLTMKTGSDNFRSSAIQDIIEKLLDNKINVIIYEPTLNTSTFEGLPIIQDIESFNQQADIIVANRMDDNIRKVKNKVLTRDLFSRD